MNEDIRIEEGYTPEELQEDIIIIPEDEEAVISVERTKTPTKVKWLWILGVTLAGLLLSLTAILGWDYYKRRSSIGVPLSHTSAENIARLQQTPAEVTPAVVMTEDSVLGVDMRLYELQGLKGEIVWDEPSKKDRDVYLYSRCIDHTTYDKADNHYLGTLVMNGEVVESNTARLGYCAMAGGNVLVGIGKDEDVTDYVVEQGGSLFRQFILVSNHEIPPTFRLHGKVERRAIGCKKDRLYYIETLNKETMWDFADALREYGFEDAVYITGGDSYSYYRTRDGVAHDLGTPANRASKKSQGIAPWVVFKKR